MNRMSGLNNEEIRSIIHEEVVKVVSDMKDTLLLQLIGFMKDEQSKIEKGEDEYKEEEQRENEVWVVNDEPELCIREPLTPVEELENYGRLTSPEVIGEYQVNEFYGNSKGNTME